MKLHFTDTVVNVLEKICSKAGTSAQQHSLYLQRRQKGSSAEEQILLNPAVSLKEQGVPYTAVLVLGPKQEYTPPQESEKKGTRSHLPCSLSVPHHDPKANGSRTFGRSPVVSLTSFLRIPAILWSEQARSTN